MIPLFKHLLDKLLHDELAVRRWGRALLMAVATGGLAFADQLAQILGSEVKAVKIAAVVAGFLSLAVTAGERNAKPDNPPAPQP